MVVIDSYSMEVVQQTPKPLAEKGSWKTWLMLCDTHVVCAIMKNILYHMLCTYHTFPSYHVIQTSCTPYEAHKDPRPKLIESNLDVTNQCYA